MIDEWDDADDEMLASIDLDSIWIRARAQAANQSTSTGPTSFAGVPSAVTDSGAIGPFGRSPNPTTAPEIPQESLVSSDANAAVSTAAPTQLEPHDALGQTRGHVGDTHRPPSVADLGLDDLEEEKGIDTVLDSRTDRPQGNGPSTLGGDDAGTPPCSPISTSELLLLHAAPVTCRQVEHANQDRCDDHGPAGTATLSTTMQAVADDACGARREDNAALLSASESEVGTDIISANGRSASDIASQAPPAADGAQHQQGTVTARDFESADSDDEPLSNIRKKERDTEKELVKKIIVDNGLWNLTARKVISLCCLQLQIELLSFYFVRILTHPCKLSRYSLRDVSVINGCRCARGCRAISSGPTTRIM